MVRSPIHTWRCSPLAQELRRSIAQAEHGRFPANALRIAAEREPA